MPLPTNNPVEKTKVDIRRIEKRIASIPQIYPDQMGREDVSEILGHVKQINEILEKYAHAQN